MTSEQQVGGKRPKKESKAAEKKPASKASSAKKSSSKKGGAVLDDVKTLAVPFAVLLAKEGLGKVFKKKDGKPSENLSPKAAARPTSSRRRTTLSGGSCNLGCGMTGGQAAKSLYALQKQIDFFLEKY